MGPLASLIKRSSTVKVVIGRKMFMMSNFCMHLFNNLKEHPPKFFLLQ